MSGGDAPAPGRVASLEAEVASLRSEVRDVRERSEWLEALLGETRAELAALWRLVAHKDGGAAVVAAGAADPGTAYDRDHGAAARGVAAYGGMRDDAVPPAYRPMAGVGGTAGRAQAKKEQYARMTAADIARQPRPKGAEVYKALDPADIDGSVRAKGGAPPVPSVSLLPAAAGPVAVAVPPAAAAADSSSGQLDSLALPVSVGAAADAEELPPGNPFNMRSRSQPAPPRHYAEPPSAAAVAANSAAAAAAQSSGSTDPANSGTDFELSRSWFGSIGRGRAKELLCSRASEHYLLRACGDPGENINGRPNANLFVLSYTSGVQLMNVKVYRFPGDGLSQTRDRSGAVHRTLGALILAVVGPAVRPFERGMVPREGG